MIVDYHVHPDYSIDASGKIIDYCNKAVALGLKELCFTTHVDLDPVRKQKDDKVRVDGKIMRMRSTWPKIYLDEIHNAKEVFKNKGLKIRAGVEVGYQPFLEEDAKSFLKKYPFDFVLGSVHCLNHIAISSFHEHSQYFQGKTPRAVLEDYYSIIELAVDSNLFDCIGHLDIYKRYGTRYMDFEAHKDYVCDVITQILKKMQNNSTALEINTSPFRNGGNEPHPGYDILKLCKKIGFDFATIGSDAHGVKNLAKDIDKGIKIAQAYGLKIHGFSKRTPYILMA